MIEVKATAVFVRGALAASVVLAILVGVPSAHAENESDALRTWGLATLADVTGPDGNRFTTEIVSLPGSPVRLVQEFETRRTALLLPAEGADTALSFDPATGEWIAAPAGFDPYVRGHDVHRLHLELLAERSAGTPAESFARLGDLHAMVRLHEEAMQAHGDADVEALLAGESPLGVHVSRGRVERTSREDLRARLGPYLESTRFERYADRVPPVVRVADDGSIGWLACEMEAIGTRRDPSGGTTPITFGFGWVELMEKHDGAWRRTGTASTTRL